MSCAFADGFKLSPIVHPKNHVLPEGAAWVTGHIVVEVLPDGTQKESRGHQTRSSGRQFALRQLQNAVNHTTIYEVVRDCKTADGRVLRRKLEVVSMTVD